MPVNLGSLWTVINIHHTFHPLLLSPCPKKRIKGPLHCWKHSGFVLKQLSKHVIVRERQNTSFSEHPAPSFLTFLLIGIFLLIFFSFALVRKELLFSTKPETGALGFVSLWCLPRSSTASGPLFTFPLFNMVWFSSTPDNFPHLWSLASLCTSVPLLLHHLTGLCSRPPPALLVCLLHLSMHVGKMCVARGMDSSFKTCTTPSLLGVQSPSIAKLAEKYPKPLLCCRLGKICSCLRQQLGNWSWRHFPALFRRAGLRLLGLNESEPGYAVRSTAGWVPAPHAEQPAPDQGYEHEAETLRICRKITNSRDFSAKTPSIYFFFS